MNELYKHVKGGASTMEIVFKVPYRYTFLYADGTSDVYENIIKFKAAKTGCYVLHEKDNHVVWIVPPTHRRIKEEPMLAESNKDDAITETLWP